MTAYPMPCTREPAPLLVRKKTSTLHDFPYEGPQRKCLHPWIVNVTPPGRVHCIHDCSFCYAREAIYSDTGDAPRVYSNLPELVERDLARLRLAPPVLLCTTTDPCQAVGAVRGQTRRVVETLLRWGVSFCLTTKGDPSFLGTLPGFWAFERKAVAISVEGPPEILQLLSPSAPSYRARLASVRTVAEHGGWVGVRLDPYFVHAYQALYGDAWWARTETLLDDIAAAGAVHVTGSTGRLDGRRAVGRAESMLARLLNLVSGVSEEVGERMRREYVRGWSGTCRGYVLREDLRGELHRRLRAACERRGMTYASCQELPESCDSPGLATCEGFRLPYVLKGADGRFHPVPRCTANCHVQCAGDDAPPCGRPELAQRAPYRPSALR
jgi:DNA repair photolyase